MECEKSTNNSSKEQQKQKNRRQHFAHLGISKAKLAELLIFFTLCALYSVHVQPEAKYFYSVELRKIKSSQYLPTSCPGHG